MIMNKKLFYAAILALAAVSCGKEEYEAGTERKETAFLEVRLASEETKASDEGGGEENSVSGYQVLIYDMSSRTLEAYQKPDPSAVSVSLRCTTGPKEVIVLANAPDVSRIVSYDAFIKTRSSLADNSLGRLVMEGHASPDLTASGGSITVDIRRIVSKVVLDGINIDFEQDAYDEMDFILKKAYLTNVAADKTYLAEVPDPTRWYNQIVRTSVPEADEMIYEALGDVNLKGTRKYTARHHFYCYPNSCTADTFSPEVWSPRPTRLVIEAVLGSVLYYYPISLPELKQNTRYHVSLNIVRPGATSPEQDMDKYAVSFNISIEEWKGPENVSETI